ncbi:uncharacterized protein MONOS_7592 [Monocercomonoides exilis]|uniref:uncharacterized protein n=1 Tax=Monocercomonoides exilis TaxID=2049356 RepID=UPI003559CE7A|nr:hypothetical protein MONOS_7592 [Monocercomonoides exilis]|eukprot:MONOS_7592.1-p1 / transcript=MONOS_7592.1 / gene=MONOS_7592 / organism=Monocercomonoides_exilis_PA203 / gene_product=unspecified product / transcript_product=unspecified product / location=Mono_scaffold00263:38945-39875(+) / protein_length=229 / sequence_SO=supercontig / SO=protein_coding / is_pseudo=false
MELSPKEIRILEIALDSTDTFGEKFNFIRSSIDPIKSLPLAIAMSNIITEETTCEKHKFTALFMIVYLYPNCQLKKHPFYYIFNKISLLDGVNVNLKLFQSLLLTKEYEKIATLTFEEINQQITKNPPEAVDIPLLDSNESGEEIKTPNDIEYYDLYSFPSKNCSNIIQKDNWIRPIPISYSFPLLQSLKWLDLDLPLDLRYDEGLGISLTEEKKEAPISSSSEVLQK